jgi:hypothetical protein
MTNETEKEREKRLIAEEKERERKVNRGVDIGRERRWERTFGKEEEK